jgi:hypothetical protein
MDLALKFKLVAATNIVIRPLCVEGDRLYPIMEISKSSPCPGGLSIIIMKIQTNDGEQRSCLLSPIYSVVVGDKDVSEINAEPGKFKLMYRKKDGCESCYFITIKA